MNSDNKSIKSHEPLWGNWIVDNIIGEGGYGRVYSVHHRDNPSFRSAVKYIQIPRSNAELQDMLLANPSVSPAAYIRSVYENIKKEITVMYSLKGIPNIVTYEDHIVYASPDGLSYELLIRMELLTPLSQCTVSGSLGEDTVRQLAIDICSALEVCEKNNIVHRDIKEGNIFIAPNGSFKLGDFGIAKHIQNDEMSIRGTPAYIAPETYTGKGSTTSSDLYSLGILMYKLLNNGRYPFMPPAPSPVHPADHDTAFAMRMQGRIPPYPANCSRELGDIILKAIQPQPGHRFASAYDMKAALTRSSDKATRLITSHPQQPRSHTLSKDVLIGVGIGFAIITAILIAVFAILKPYNTPQPAQETYANAAPSASPVDPGISVVHFSDPIFEDLIRQRLSRPYGDITYDDLAGITDLAILGDFCFKDYYSYYQAGDSENRENGSFEYNGTRYSRGRLTDISDIVYLKNLRTLSICCTSISDISPLAQLHNLTDIKLNSNIYLSDIRPLAAMGYKGTSLDLWRNNISDISPLSGMHQLEKLQLSSNNIEDISPLSTLTNLKTLNLYKNIISDIYPLASLYKLEDLRLNANQISDLWPLSELSNLTELRLNNNLITDITPLRYLTNLNTLYIQDNYIRDFSPLYFLNITTGNTGNQH